MTKTERWYAIVEELRAVSPRPRSAQWLADRFEVSRRTIERDLDGLLQSGVPLYAELGRTGGWVLDPDATYRPPALDAAEVTALAVGVRLLEGTPFAEAGRLAMRKLSGSLGERSRRDADASASKVALVRDRTPAGPVPRAVERAVRDGRVVRLSYADASGAATARDVEPVGFLGGDGGHWYLIGWCRLRDGVRGFRLDRIVDIAVLDEAAPPREIDLTTVATGRDVILLGNSDSTVSPGR